MHWDLLVSFGFQTNITWHRIEGRETDSDCFDIMSSSIWFKFIKLDVSDRQCTYLLLRLCCVTDHLIIISRVVLLIVDKYELCPHPPIYNTIPGRWQLSDIRVPLSFNFIMISLVALLIDKYELCPHPPIYNTFPSRWRLSDIRVFLSFCVCLCLAGVSLISLGKGEGQM